MNLLILILVLILLFGSAPTWSYSSNWGYGPSGLFSVILLFFIIMFFFGGRF